jgi:phosphoribosylaminoimidazolecarboxamide formyltransferase/IMP cyclohydrolase
MTKIGQLTPEEEENLLLAWAIGSTSNSNTVTLVKNGCLIGNGVGQQDRVGGCVLAVRRARDANHETSGAFAYSDSFFPFADGPEVLNEAGVRAIFASSGSVRDSEVQDSCRDKDMVLYLIPDKVGRGFFGH